MLVDVLTQFCTKVHIDPADISGAESPTGYNLAITLNAGEIKSAVRSDYDTLAQIFGSALNLSVSRNEFVLFEINMGQLPPDFDQSLDRVQALPDVSPLTLNLSINKSTLIQSLCPDTGGYHTLFFFFEERFIALLNAELRRHDELLFAGAYQPSLIIVSSASYYFAGRMLVIVGEAHLTEAQRALRPIDGRTHEALQRFHTFAVENLNWREFNFQRVTPIHYLGEWPHGAQETICRILTRQILHLSIIYTANITNYANSSFQCAYSNSERNIVLRLGDEVIEKDLISILPRLVLWPSSGKGVDHLTIFQNVVARDIDEGNPIANYQRFVLRLRQLLTDAAWHHRVFINGKIDKHFEELEKIAGYTAQTSKQVSDTIDSITKSLTDALLATVGVVVASFLAALIKNETQSTIFAIAMGAYVVYLVLFAAYRMGSIYHNYHLATQEADVRIRDYIDRIGKKKVDDITEPLTKRKYQFLSWFWGTIVIYIILSISLVYASTWLPQELVNRGIIVPTPTATATITPAPTLTPSPTPTLLPTGTPLPTRNLGVTPTP